jgi:hypothetical protein
MKKIIIIAYFVFCFSVLFIDGQSAHAQATGGGCGFNTAGDYLCEGGTLSAPPNPGTPNIPAYGGPASQDVDLPPPAAYTPGDLIPGTVMPYIPIIPIFDLPPTIPLPGVPIIPLIFCNTDPTTTTPNPVTPGATGGCEDFYDAVRQRESSNNYQARRPGSQYWGAYQMGDAARQDAGYGNVSSQEFLNNPAMQDAAIRRYHDVQWGYIQNMGLDQYEGQTIGGRVMTRSAMIGGAHLLGVGGLRDYLQSGGTDVGSDGLGTQITEYMDRFGGYDITECVN